MYDRHDMRGLLDAAEERVQKLFMDDDQLSRLVEEVTNRTLGWSPVTDEDEQDLRYDTWWATRCNIQYMVTMRALSKWFFPHPAPFANEEFGRK